MLVNNAGIMPVGPFVQETDAMAHRMIDINLDGVIFGSKLALERFLPRRSGHLVNIASSAGKLGVPGRRHLLRHQACGRRPQRGDPRRGAPQRHERLGRDAGRGQHRAVLGAAAAARLQDAEPEEVADAIVEALQTGRFEVYVPKSLALTLRLNALMPTRVKDLIGRALGHDRVLLSADHTTRGAYEQRMARTESGTFVGPAAAAPEPSLPEPAQAEPEREAETV